ncbi:hypothetical protein [Mucilaginibacter boryungensis]|uniref:Radical SAM superfamily enzyme YgiQ (UPF0313 family) n=1 Tax=Mucilaginibacter boryungensis TaxID=768480 RepID=A0ABR9XDR4_9SPHI|nr:hypothetical protein [Mucilaginibacter boryungensis]MBE9665386.1 hypothetical protein [Mucilaginibacter boryungensis]
MKIATYHRRLGDEVEFFKGELKEFVLIKLTDRCINDLRNIDGRFNWDAHKGQIREFIKTKKIKYLPDLPFSEHNSSLEIIRCLDDYAIIYQKKQYDRFPKWDRIYVTTLFTFYWKITVETIHYAKHLIVDHNQLFVGGVLASLLQKELEVETGVIAHPGLLDQPGMLDPENPMAKHMIIDNLPLDYSILDEIDYEYPTGSAYFTFMTKGCTRKCAFCSVPILEPTYKPKIETIDKFLEIKQLYGEQQNLLLMDNNVLASPNFPDIIQEIKDMGFYKGATFVEPNQYEIAYKNLSNGLNDVAYVKRTFKLLQALYNKLNGEKKKQFGEALKNAGLTDFDSINKDLILATYSEVSPLYEKFRSKGSRLRYVDFNQGTDARYVTDELMKLMSEIPIRPLRIAFDYWGMKDKYEAAVRLAGKYKIKELSNYILYNFKDSPEELYKRLLLNVILSEELNMTIYSFPMKYIPLFGEEAKTRDFIGNKWNKKFIRTIQSILNVTKGIVAPGRKFFERAFGKDLKEFQELLYMPEAYVIYRKVFEENGLTETWRALFRKLSTEQLSFVQDIIQSNNFKDHVDVNYDPHITALLNHYKITKDEIDQYQNADPDIKILKTQTHKMLKEDIFKDLTLTYDFEPETYTRTKKMIINL